MRGDHGPAPRCKGRERPLQTIRSSRNRAILGAGRPPGKRGPALEAASDSPGEATDALWQRQLLGGFELSDGRQRITRLSSRAAVTLLARLALWPDRAPTREELVDVLWPGVAIDAGRHRLRQTLSSLRSLLEPPQREGNHPRTPCEPVQGGS